LFGASLTAIGVRRVIEAVRIILVFSIRLVVCVIALAICGRGSIYFLFMLLLWDGNFAFRWRQCPIGK
jgi:hypothetical protein